MRRPKRTSWKLKGNLTEQALIILRRIYKSWASCLLEIVEYSSEKKYIKCRVRVPGGDYRYTKVKPLYVTCIQHEHVLAQLSIIFFYFLVRDGAIEIFEEEKDLQRVENFIKKLGFLARWELRKIKKLPLKEQKSFLNKRAAEILVDLYLFSDEKQIIEFTRKVLASEEFIIEVRWIRRYVGPTKLPGSVFKIRGEYTREDKVKKISKTREFLQAKIYNTVYARIFDKPKA